MNPFFALILVSTLFFCPKSNAGEPRFRVHEIGRPGGNNFGQTSAVDVDNDGDLDLISGRQFGDVFWFENRGADGWRQRLIGHKALTDVGGVAFDVDGDGWLDQVSGGTWYRNPGNPGEAGEWQRFENGTTPAHDNLAADIDGDGKLDLLSIQDKAGVFWYRIAPDPAAHWIEHRILGVTTPQCHGGIAVGDIDGDGDNDVARVDRWLENRDGTGEAWVEHRAFDFGKEGPWGIQTRARLIDVDRDGDLDLIQAEGDVLDGRVAWFENRRDGANWERHLIKSPGHSQDFHSLCVADFDNDGDMDIFSGGGPLTQGEHQWFFWENADGRGGVWNEHLIERGRRTHESVCGDVDGDGDIDILTKPWNGDLHLFVENLFNSQKINHPIEIDPEYPHSFHYKNGERFFPMGDTAYVLLGGPKNVIARYIDVRRAHKFNFIRIMAAANGNWPFGGTAERPDYTVINELAMQKLDWLFDYAAGRGMNIELILWGYGVGGGEGLWANQAHQNLWVDTLTERYKDRPNLLMYTVANEFERYPDGKYAFDPSDVEWAQRVAARIRERDRIHPIGCHPSVWITDQDAPNEGRRPFATYKGFTQRRPQVVWPLWDGSPLSINVTQNNEGVQRRTWGDFDGGHGLTYHPTQWQGIDYPARWTDAGWDFEGAGMEDCIAEDWAHGKPVLNTEFGYQFEPGMANPNPVRTQGWTSAYLSHQCHDPAATRKKAWKIATAGGYFAAGFSNSYSGDFSLEEIDNFRPAHLETLYDFFTNKTEYWKMAPHLELVAAHNSVLAAPGVEYVVYFPRGGTNSVELVAGRFAVEWLHAKSGEYYPQPAFTAAAGRREFAPPEHPSDDWVLHLHRTD